MYASWTQFSVKPGMREQMEQLADELHAAMKPMNGFVSATFLSQPESNKYGALTVWNSREAAEAAQSITESKLQAAISGIAQGPPERDRFEVYEPKA